MKFHNNYIWHAMLFSILFAGNAWTMSMEKESKSKIVRDEMKFYSDYIIDSTDIVNDRIRIMGGDLFIYGQIDNKVTVIGGDVTIGATAIINGEIIAVGGTVLTQDGAIINGKIIEANLNEGLVYRETFTDSAETRKNAFFELKRKSDWLREGWIHPKDDFLIYNRNEGARITFFDSDFDHGDHSPFRLSVSTAYRTALKDFTGRITFEKSFFKNRFFILYGSVFKEAKSDDEYRITEEENTIASLFARQDFYDRWDEEGWELGFALDFNRLKFKAFTSDVQQDSIPVNNSLWSIAEKDRALRGNPFVQPSRQVGLYKATLAFQSKNHHPLKTGYAFLVQGEQIINDGDGEYLDETNEVNVQKPRNRMLIMSRINLEFSPGLVFRNQTILGLSNGHLHSFRNFGIGGIGSVSAFPYKTKSGDHMIQTNVELIMTPDFTDENMFFKVFFDSGLAFDSDKMVDIKKISDRKNDFISAVGIGIGTESEDGLGVGFNLAKPLNDSDYLETTIRLHFNF
ncbi:MAG: hypothetical protein HN994_04175 [Candidatus Marinimicrobia bacterium]|nr:hypothetical protein [Candidatus Neomarinimicrobiota bacterium]